MTRGTEPVAEPRGIPSLFDDDDDARRFMSRDECAALAARVLKFTTGGGQTNINIRSTWDGELRWAKNRPTVTGDRRDNMVQIARVIRGAAGNVNTNQTDDESLKAAVVAAERILTHFPESPEDIVDPPTKHTYPETHIWSKGTYDQAPGTRGAIVHRLVEPTRAQGMVSAGYLSVAAAGNAYIDSLGRSLYAPQTYAECSITVRDPKGAGSGWAGASSYDWARFDADAIAAVALDKCLRSRNPVAVEPGRFTAILEPQATYEFISAALSQPALYRPVAEQGPPHPYFKGVENVTLGGKTEPMYMSKLGMRLFDPRITVSHDPTDPDLGVVPFAGPEEPYRTVTWIDKGVLARLSYDRRFYSLPLMNEDEGYPRSGVIRMSGGTTSIDEMIKSTERGVLVTRFSGLGLIDFASLLFTGYTRDGLWLIEKGAISKPIKNFRFTESPLFIFNNLDQMGAPVPVFSPRFPAVIPPVKVRDFSFTSLVDAV